MGEKLYSVLWEKTSVFCNVIEKLCIVEETVCNVIEKLCIVGEKKTLYSAYSGY